MYLHFVDRRQDRALAGGGGHNPVHPRGRDIHNQYSRRARSCSESSLAAFFLPSLLAAPTDDSSADQPTSARFWLACSCIQLNYWTSGNLWKRMYYKEI